MNMTQLQQYQKKYTQFNLLGRGNYGSAYLVKSKINNQQFVAKKMMLQGLSQKQVDSAWGQIQILKKVSQLKCPFIVKYKQSFNFDNTLIIIMEYCQYGDLSTFLKNWKKKNQPLHQKVIINWFIQMLFGIRVLHSKKILHRDLKSANIFLTSNKAIKIGDFGISKVLQTSSAKTFVGTPYYLSPQVCQNKPYNFKSDLWSLGCILYQLCTLTYPFQASNLLGLAMKILNQQVKPIPNYYPKQLNNIIMLLLTKNQSDRVAIQDILKLSYIQSHMKSFNQLQINQLVGNFKKLSPKSIQQQQSTQIIQKPNQDTMKTINSQYYGTISKNDTLNYSNTISKNDTLNYSNTMSNTQKLKLKKLQQADKNAQIQKKAILQNNYQTRNFAKNKKQQNLSTSNTLNQTDNKKLIKKIQIDNQKTAQLKYTLKKLQHNQCINLQQLSQTISKFKNISGTDIKYQQVPLPSQQQYIYLPKKNIIIQSNDQDLQQYYDDDFQDQIQQQIQSNNFQNTIPNKSQLQDIQAFYACQAGKPISPTKKAKIQNAYSQQKLLKSNQQKINILRNKCIQQLGLKKFQQIYKNIKSQNFDFNNIKKNYQKYQIQSIHSIQMLVYMQNQK